MGSMHDWRFLLAAGALLVSGIGLSACGSDSDGQGDIRFGIAIPNYDGDVHGSSDEHDSSDAHGHLRLQLPLRASSMERPEDEAYLAAISLEIWDSRQGEIFQSRFDYYHGMEPTLRLSKLPEEPFFLCVVRGFDAEGNRIHESIHRTSLTDI